MSPSQKSKLSECLKQLARDKGNQEAWQQVYGLLWARVVSTTYLALGGLKDRAEDAAQEVFYRLVRYTDFSRVRTADEFLGYVRVVCENVAADFLKELVHRTISLEDGLNEEDEARLTPASPEQLVITAELSERLQEALEPQERELLQLMTEGHKDGEIADRLGWSYRKTGVRIYRLRVKVRKLLIALGL
jgi:RNA polymerase sigma factor (sigma-70 family)